jgi:AmiR/NasT family two-component response regulator
MSGVSCVELLADWCTVHDLAVERGERINRLEGELAILELRLKEITEIARANGLAQLLEITPDK